MPLIQLNSFGGQAEILGTPKEVHFAGEMLTISNVTLAEAKMLLEVLSTGQIKGTQLFDAARSATNDLLEASRPSARAAAVPATPASAAQEPVASASTPAPATPTTSNGGGRAAAETKSAPEAKADKPARAARTAAPKSAPAEEAADAPAEAKAAPAKAAAETPAPTSTSAPANEDALIEMISKKSRLRDIVTALHEAGSDYDNAPKILAACERMRERVPVLKRAADLNVRIPKIAASFGIPV